MTRTTLLKLIQMYIGTDQPWISLVEGDEQQEYRPKCVSCCVNKIANIFDVDSYVNPNDTIATEHVI